MAEPLVNQYGADVPQAIARMITAVHPAFEAKKFMRDVLQGYDTLTLMPRGKHIARALQRHLPPPGRQVLYERNRYSPAVKSNGFLFVSGQVGSREDGSPEPDLEAQVRLAFDNLNAILKAAACSLDDVVDVTVFIVDPESAFETVWKVLPDYWGETPHPTLTGVGVTWLYGFQFEIKVIAKLPEPVVG